MCTESYDTRARAAQDGKQGAQREREGGGASREKGNNREGRKGSCSDSRSLRCSFAARKRNRQRTHDTTAVPVCRGQHKRCWSRRTGTAVLCVRCPLCSLPERSNVKSENQSNISLRCWSRHADTAVVSCVRCPFLSLPERSNVKSENHSNISLALLCYPPFLFERLWEGRISSCCTQTSSVIPWHRLS